MANVVNRFKILNLLFIIYSSNKRFNVIRKNFTEFKHTFSVASGSVSNYKVKVYRALAISDDD